MSTYAPLTKAQLLEASIEAARSHDRRGAVDFLLADYARSIRDGDSSATRQDPQALAALLKATAQDASDEQDPKAEAAAAAAKARREGASPPLVVHGGGASDIATAGDGAGRKAFRDRLEAVKAEKKNVRGPTSSP